MVFFFKTQIKDWREEDKKIEQLGLDALITLPGQSEIKVGEIRGGESKGEETPISTFPEVKKNPISDLEMGSEKGVEKGERAVEILVGENNENGTFSGRRSFSLQIWPTSKEKKEIPQNGGGKINGLVVEIEEEKEEKEGDKEEILIEKGDEEGGDKEEERTKKKSISLPKRLSFPLRERGISVGKVVISKAKTSIRKVFSPLRFSPSQSFKDPVGGSVQEGTEKFSRSSANVRIRGQFSFLCFFLQFVLISDGFKCFWGPFSMISPQNYKQKRVIITPNLQE